LIQPNRDLESDVSRREARAHRILDAAAILIQRWGYEKTTLDDISREAGVAKATMYLHWKTREALFAALIQRERVAMGEEVKQRIVADPEGATLRGILKHSALAVLKRPLMKAILLGDMEMLGKLARGDQRNAARLEKIVNFKTYLDLLRERGMVRTDLSLREQVYTFSAIFMGFFFIAQFMPAEYSLSDEEIADMIAETVHRTLEPDRMQPSDVLQAASQGFSAYMEQAVGNIQSQFQADLRSDNGAQEP
jgi:AcrR family transcriptional regulator